MDQIDKYSRPELSRFLRNALANCLIGFSLPLRNFAFSTPPTQSAILVPLLWTDQQWNLLFIRRSVSNDPHSGQVAFPGGRMESTDLSPEAASLRETHEEIGVSPTDVEVLGKLPPLLTVTNYQIQPVVGIIPYPYPFKPSPGEVQKIFTIPLSWLANPQNYRLEERHLPPPVGRVPTIYYLPYAGEILWGASAQIVHTFLTIVKKNKPRLRRTRLDKNLTAFPVFR